MTTPATDANPILAPLLPGYDDNAHQKNVALRVKNVATDATTGVIYGDLGVDVTVSLPADQTVNIDKIGGQSPTLDNTTILAVSMRGKGAGTAGDTAILLDSTGRQLIGISTTALFTATQTTVGTSNSGDLDTSKLRELSIDITTSAHAGTNPTIQFFLNRKGADGIYYPLWQSAVLSASANTISTSIGAGMAYNQSLGPTCQLSWTVGGTATPTWTFTPNVYGK